MLCHIDFLRKRRYLKWNDRKSSKVYDSIIDNHSRLESQISENSDKITRAKYYCS